MGGVACWQNNITFKLVISSMRISRDARARRLKNAALERPSGAASCPVANRRSFPAVKRSGMMLTSHYHIVLRFRMNGAVPPLTIRLHSKKVKVKWSRYRTGVAQRVCRGIALLFHDRGTRTGWVVSITPRPHFTAGKDPVPILQEAEWAPGPVWTSGKSRPHRDSILDPPGPSHSLYRLS